MEVAWWLIHFITSTHAACFMILTQDEVSTSRFWAIGSNGASEGNANGLRVE